jgi:hypothetical protein
MPPLLLSRHGTALVHYLSVTTRRNQPRGTLMSHGAADKVRISNCLKHFFGIQTRPSIPQGAYLLVVLAPSTSSESKYDYFAFTVFHSLFG